MRLLRSLRVRRALFAVLVLAFGPWVALGIAAALTPLPPELTSSVPPSTGVILRDRSGVVIRELGADDGSRARWVTLADVGEPMQRMMIAAEDRRFAHHPGIDPFAIARAAVDLARYRRVVSGASTLTQQLARTLVPRPRSLWGKFREAALALRIEASLSKAQILTEYLNRVSFGPGLRGVDAASRYYFDKPPIELSLAEAAALASLPRGPTLYDPRKGTARLQRRRDRVLERARGAALAAGADVDRALAEPLRIAPTGAGLGAPHLVRAIMGGKLDDVVGPLRNRAREITLTLDRGLQREVEILAADTTRRLAPRHVSAAAVVILENRSGEVLAYVGSPSFDDVKRLGQNDGVLALRQPGSTLKPFVYELAMEKLGYTAATALPDVELFLPTKDGDYRPNNYDGRFHGPVRLREALASSFNVPAVWTAEAVGPARLLERLRALGFRSLGEDASRYGAALALGDGEVRLLDLAAAYTTLARGGLRLAPRAVRAVLGKDGQPLALPSFEEERVLDEGAAFVITDVLADKTARQGAFGEGSALELPFPCAAKTGTSKGFRDNYAVGFTPAVTVAVWVGNFDGSPMEGVSGVTGAGPLFHDAMAAAARRFPAGAFERPAGKIEEAEVCSLSGEVPGDDCPHARREIFAPEGGLGAPPKATCSMHERVRIDERNGLRAGPGCPSGVVKDRVYERFDARLMAWARGAARSLAPEKYSPLCPAPADGGRPGAGAVRIAYPPEGARFAVDPGASASQSIRIRVDVPAGVTEARLTLDGQTHTLRAPFELAVRMIPGAHHARVECAAGADEVDFSVD